MRSHDELPALFVGNVSAASARTPQRNSPDDATIQGWQLTHTIPLLCLSPDRLVVQEIFRDPVANAAQKAAEAGLVEGQHPDVELTCTIAIPGQACGLILGKGGERINALRATTQVTHVRATNPLAHRLPAAHSFFALGCNPANVHRQAKIQMQSKDKAVPGKSPPLLCMCQAFSREEYKHYSTRDLVWKAL